MWTGETNIKGPKGDKGDPGTPGAPGAPGVATTLMSDTPPIGATNGALWVETDTGYLYFYYNDGTSSQWVMVSPGSGGISQADADLRYVNVTGDTMTGDLALRKTTPILILDKTDGGAGASAIHGRNNGVLRWGVSFGGVTPENAEFFRCSDAGSPTLTFSIARLTGVADFEKKPTVAGQVWAAPFDAMAYNGMQINGSFDVSQERGFNNPSAVTANNVCDGWIFSSGVGAAVISAAVNTIAGTTLFPGSNYLSAAVTTAAPSLTGSDVACFTQKMEGYRVQRLNWGFANAQPITIGFWTGHARAGTYSVFVRNAPTYDRRYVTTYTQNAASTWQYNVVTIPGDTTGTWGRTNGAGIELGFTQAAAPNLTVSAANVWGAGIHLAAPGQVNAVAATSDVFNLANVVVLPGIEAPSAARSPLIMRPFDQELLTCQRYFQVVAEPGASRLLGKGHYLTAAQLDFPITFPFPMRSSPALLVSGGTAYFMSSRAGGNETFQSFVAAVLSPTGAWLYSTGMTGTSGAGASITYNNAAAKVSFDARL